jgi:tetratricopeptide (TPR) repeat protein
LGNLRLVAKKLLGEDNPYKKTLIPKLYFLHARSLAGSTNPRDWDKGLQIIDSALSVAPKAAYSHYTKGILFVSKHRFFTAIKYFTKATELAPGWTYALHNLAKAYFDVAEYDKSINLSKLVIKKDSLYSEAYSLIALNYENIKMYDSAAYWNKLALAIDSTNTEANYNLGRIYLKWKDNSQMANEYFYNAVYKLQDVSSIAAIGSWFTRQRQYDSAQYYYNWALSIDRYHHESIGKYANLLKLINKTGSADSLYTDAIQRMGNDSRIYAQYLAFKFSQGAYTTADSLFNILVTINHEDPSIFIDYSRLLESSGDLLKARSILHQGLSFFTNSPSTIYSLANLYFKQNKNSLFTEYALDSSLYYFKRSREITPTYSFTHFGLYQVNFAMGNIDSAMAALDKARSINKYIQSITNYNPDLLSVADKALAKKDYKLAIKYYKLAKEFSNDFKTNWKLSLVYYLSGDLAEASTLCNNLMVLAKAKSQLKDLQLLQAEILFDQKRFSEAVDIFRKLDDNDPLPNYLEQAACEFMLGNAEKAKSLVLEGKNNDASSINIFLEMEGLRYSSFMIETIKKVK